MLTKLQSKFEAQMAKKRAIEDNAARTRSRMEQVCDCGLQAPFERVKHTRNVAAGHPAHLKKGGRWLVRLGGFVLTLCVPQGTNAVYSRHFVMIA